MKKTNKFVKVIVFMLLLSMTLCSMFACGENGNTEDTTDNVDTTETTSDTTAETTAAETYEAMEAETVAEDVQALVGSGELKLKECSIILGATFAQGGVNYNWNTFYNACIAGKIDTADSAVYSYVIKSFNTFKTQGMDAQVGQAEAVLEFIAK